MARITPIDVIKGISGKYGSGSNDYFATNSSSNRIHLAKYLNKPTGAPTQEQLNQMQKFGLMQKMAAAWLRANRPTDLKAEVGSVEHDGTPAYQEALSIKKMMHLSNIRQVVLKYMDQEGNVVLPSGETGEASGSGTPTTRYTLSLSASPVAGGSVTGAGQYNAGASASITATPNGGYTFSRWSDGNTSANRILIMDSDKSLSAIFVTEGSGGSTGEGTGQEGGDGTGGDEDMGM